MPRHRGFARRTFAVIAALLIACLPARSISLDVGTSVAEAAASPFETLFTHRGLIKKGDRGDIVKSLQQALNALGYETSADGVFGEETTASLKEFQSDRRLDADGVAGPSTLASLASQYYKANPPDTHTVKSGETLSIIGDRYNISVNTLASINALRDPDTIYVGQVLALKGEQVAVTEPDPAANPDPAQPVGAEPVQPLPIKRICLSFNDGPDVYTTRQILTILDSYGIKATFFLIGNQAAQNPDLVSEIAAAGHVIGVHGFEHKVLAGLSASEVHKDLAKAQDLLQEITGVKPYLYRPPGGLLDRTQVEEAERLGLTTLMWTNIGGADLDAGSSAEVASRVVQGAKDGGVILLHEGLQYTVEALPSIIEALARDGYGFQNVSAGSR